MSVIALRIAQPYSDDYAAQFRSRHANPWCLPASKLTEALMAAVRLDGHTGFDIVHLHGDRDPDTPINLTKAKDLLGWEP